MLTVARFTLAIASTGYVSAMKISSSQVPVRKGVSQLVTAQLSGAVAGLMLAVDQLLPEAPHRPKIVDRDLTRC
ncbi:hypothetical protein MAIC_09360 [Mycolicibacterium aichiense]|uniref:Uncharacterized protein n=2 Tax=Mycolicibacterium aichiense TaxID=1799 RepID=A0AAD1HIR4_9MYCO|nr:hypothetical protein MAIC_09360 [Mycolicibacterium aichiense]STZ24527.1 Uncharacterised protein [Mycolicibacterium aichiense]